MKYYKTRFDGTRSEISYGEALCFATTVYKDNEITREMLKMEGIIPLPYFSIEVEDEVAVNG